MNSDDLFDVPAFCARSFKLLKTYAYPLGQLWGLDNAAIDDAISDGYVHFLESIEKLQEFDDVRRMGYLCLCVKWKMLAIFRDRSRHPIDCLDDCDEPGGQVDDFADGLVETLAANDEWPRAKVAIGRLCPAHQELLGLLITDVLNCEHLTPAERDRRIARVLGKTEAAIRVQRLRAVVALRRALEDGGEEVGHERT